MSNNKRKQGLFLPSDCANQLLINIERAIFFMHNRQAELRAPHKDTVAKFYQHCRISRDFPQWSNSSAADTALADPHGCSCSNSSCCAACYCLLVSCCGAVATAKQRVRPLKCGLISKSLGLSNCDEQLPLIFFSMLEQSTVPLAF